MQVSGKSSAILPNQSRRETGTIEADNFHICFALWLLSSLLFSTFILIFFVTDDIVDIFSDGGNISSSIIRGLTYALVLHPIAAAITLFALIISLTTNWCLDICGSLFAWVTLVFFFPPRSQVNLASLPTDVRKGSDNCHKQLYDLSCTFVGNIGGKPY